MKAFISGLFIAITLSCFPQEKESAIIKETVEKYINAFYLSKPELLEETLHPELIKRTIGGRPNEVEVVITRGKSDMIQLSKVFNARNIYSASSRADITVMDINDKIATAKLIVEGWTDYLQLAKINGKWQIINVLWIMD